MPNGLMQQNARPSGTKSNIHDACRRWNSIQIDQSDAQGLARQPYPMIAFDQPRQRVTATTAYRSTFAAAVFLNNHADIYPRHRACVGHGMTFGAQYYDFLQRRRDGR